MVSRRWRLESGECGDALFIYIKLLLSCEMYSRFLFSPDRLLIYAQSEMRHVSSDPVEMLYWEGRTETGREYSSRYELATALAPAVTSVSVLDVAGGSSRAAYPRNSFTAHHRQRMCCS